MTAEETALTAVAILSFPLTIFFTLGFKSIIMVFTDSQTENMSRNGLAEKLLKLSDVSSKISDLTEKFNDFVSKYGKLYSELKILRS